MKKFLTLVALVILAINLKPTIQQEGWCRPLNAWILPNCSYCHKTTGGNCPQLDGAQYYDNNQVYAELNCDNWNTYCSISNPLESLPGYVEPVAPVEPDHSGWCRPLNAWILKNCSYCHKTVQGSCPQIGGADYYDNLQVQQSLNCGNWETYCSTSVAVEDLPTVNDVTQPEPTPTPTPTPTVVTGWCVPKNSWLLTSCNYCHRTVEGSCPQIASADYFENHLVASVLNCGDWNTYCVTSVEAQDLPGNQVNPTPPEPTNTGAPEGWCNPPENVAFQDCSQCIYKTADQTCPQGYGVKTVEAPVCNANNDVCSHRIQNVYSGYCKKVGPSYLVENCATDCFFKTIGDCPFGYENNQVYGGIFCGAWQYCSV